MYVYRLLFVLVGALGIMGHAWCAGFNDPSWDSLRLTSPITAPLVVGPLVGHSIGDVGRLERHTEDMLRLFRQGSVLSMWGGLNARDDEAGARAAITRFHTRAANNLMSWELFYRGDGLATVIGAHCPKPTGSLYDGYAEILWVTDPECWRQGLAPMAADAFIRDHVGRVPGVVAFWCSIDPENAASLRVAEKLGFTPCSAADTDNPAFPGHGRENRRFFMRKILPPHQS